MTTIQINLGEKRKNFRLFAASSFDGANEILRQEKIDLAMIDYELGSLKGSDLINQIKDEYPSLKIILITGNSLSFIENIDGINNIDVVIEKTSLHETLVSTIQRLISD